MATSLSSKKTHVFKLTFLSVVFSLFIAAGIVQGAEGGHLVKVKVVDADTGEAVANVPYSYYAIKDNKIVDRKQVASDSNGEISLTVPDKSDLQLSLVYSGMKGISCDVKWTQQNGGANARIAQVTADKNIELKIKLIPTLKLAGTVVDSKGDPVYVARIYYNQYTRNMMTDKEGAFVFETSPADRDYELYFVNKDRSEAKLVKVAKGTANIKVKLTPTFTLEGKAVIEDGKPAEKLQFRTSLTLNGTPVQGASATYTTDENGKFEIKNACEGTNVTASWYSSSSSNANYWNGNQTITALRGKTAILKARIFIDDWDAPGNIAKNAETKCKKLSNYCLDPQDNILACDERDKVIRKISPEDKLLETWKLDFAPQAIDCKADGTVIVAGGGKIALLDKTGKVICQSDLVGTAASGIGFTNNDIFAAVRVKTGFVIVRMDDKFQGQKVIVNNLRGCCGQFDITARDGFVYAAANTKFRIYKYDREGKQVFEMGEKGKTVEEGFSGCCEPKNLFFDKAGDLYASESGNCCIKRFSADGKSFELLGKVNGIRGCVRVSIALNSKGDKAYMLDTKRNIIRCMAVPAKFIKKQEVKEYKVTAKVIDVDTGKPVANAVYRVGITTDKKRKPSKKYTSDANGIISFAVPKGGGFTVQRRNADSTKLNLDVKWMQRNVSSYMNYGEIKGDKDIELKLKIIPSTVLTGTVLDSSGVPVAGGQIYYDRKTKKQTTNDKGVFVFEKSPVNSTYQLYVTNKDGSEATIASVAKGATSIEIKLAPTFSVEGKAVIEDDKPASKLNFRTTVSLNGDALYLGNQYTADKDGKFEIKNVCEGLEVTASWYSSSKTNLDYLSGRKIVRFKKGEPLLFKAKSYQDDWKKKSNIAVSDETKCKSLSNYCLDPQDNILACDAGNNMIRKISPDDKLIADWKLDFSPQAIDCKADGTVIVAGKGKIALLDKTGKVICQNDMPGSSASGIGYTGSDIFVAARVKTGFAIIRMNAKLQEQKIIVNKLRGCCGQFDITARDGYVYAAANTKFRIYKYDRDGKMVLEMGEKGKTVETGFSGCCEPKNLCWDKEGNLYASESGNCCVKRFAADGKSFEMIGKVDGIRGCVRVSIAVNSQGDKIYMLDTKRSIIRCLPVPAMTAAKSKYGIRFF